MKKLTIILVYLLIASSLYSQDLLVAHEMDVYQVAVDKQDRFIIAGNLYGYETHDLDFSSNVVEINSFPEYKYISEMFIACYDSLMNYNWHFTLGLGSQDNIYKILTDDSCNIYISGYAAAGTDFDPSDKVAYLSPTSNFFAKYDRSGKLVWVKQTGFHIHTLFHNHIYGFINEGYKNDRIKKYDLNGNVIWSIRVPYHSNIIFDNDSKFYFSIDTVRVDYIGHPLTIYAVDTLGQITNKTFSQAGAFNHEKIYWLNNKIAIHGEYWGDPDFNSAKSILHNSTTFEVYQHGQYTGMWVHAFMPFKALYDPEGHLIMASDQPPFPDQYLSDPWGNIYTTGSITGSENLGFKNQQATMSSPGAAYYLAKYDSDLNFISAVKLSENDKIQFNLFHPVLDNMLFWKNYTILTGRFNNLALRQDTSFNPSYPYGHFLIYKNFDIPSLSTPNAELKDPGIAIYPNPVVDQLTIELSQQRGETTLSIYQLKGQEIIHRQLVNNKTVLDMKAYNKGIYLIKLSNNKTQITRKIVKQ